MVSQLEYNISNRKLFKTHNKRLFKLTEDTFTQIFSHDIA